jgi:hypothetical protein
VAPEVAVASEVAVAPEVAVASEVAVEAAEVAAVVAGECCESKFKSQEHGYEIDTH